MRASDTVRTLAQREPFPQRRNGRAEHWWMNLAGKECWIGNDWEKFTNQSAKARNV